MKRLFPEDGVYPQLPCQALVVVIDAGAQLSVLLALPGLYLGEFQALIRQFVRYPVNPVLEVIGRRIGRIDLSVEDEHRPQDQRPRPDGGNPDAQSISA